MIVLITGPVRSGKSARAAHVARAFGAPVIYIATARVDPTDTEMAARVARHRSEREAVSSLELWQANVPDLPAVIAGASPGSTLLIDSLGTWIAGHLLDLESVVESDPVAGAAALEERTERLMAPVRAAQCGLVFVSEEAGWGVVPPTRQGRVFRDVLGRLAQRIAQSADRVELVVAGYALNLTAHGAPISACFNA